MPVHDLTGRTPPPPRDTIVETPGTALVEVAPADELYITVDQATHVVEVDPGDETVLYVSEPITLDLAALSGLAIPELARQLVAATVVSGHRAVTQRADGTVEYASCTRPDHVEAPLWLTTQAAAAGDLVRVLIAGVITETSWSWARGPVYVGPAGVLTQTPPGPPGALFLGRIGTATGPTTLVVEHHPSIALTP